MAVIDGMGGLAQAQEHDGRLVLGLEGHEQDDRRGLEVVERDITREELGRSPADLDASGQIVLAVIRKGIAHRFDTNTINRLESGDRLVVIRHNPTER